MIRTLFIFISISFLNGSFAADTVMGESDLEIDFLKNRRRKHPVGVNVGVLGITGWGNVSADVFIKSKLNIEGGFGINASGETPIAYFAGVKYHALAKTPSNITPYFGVCNSFFINDGQFHQHNLYFPIGIHKIKRNRFTWALELAYQFNQYTDRNIWGGFKIGYRIL